MPRVVIDPSATGCTIGAPRPLPALIDERRDPMPTRKIPSKPVARKPSAKKGPARARIPKGMSIAEYGASLGSPRREVLEAIRALVREAAPDMDEAVKWGMPTYGCSELI